MGYRLKKDDHKKPEEFTLESMLKTKFFNEEDAKKIFDDTGKIDKPVDIGYKSIVWSQNCVKHFKKRLEVDGKLHKEDVVLEIYILFKYVLTNEAISKEDAFESACHVYGHLQEGIDDYLEKSKAGHEENSVDMMVVISKEVFEHIGVVDISDVK